TTLDHEAKPSYEVRVRVNDGANQLEKLFTVSVTNGNEAPTGITPPSGSVDENLPGGVIATLTVTDPDEGDTHALEVVDELERFEIVAGVLKLNDNVSLKYEDGATVTVEITATDSGSPSLGFSQEFVITVNDVDEPPRTCRNEAMPPDVDEDAVVSLGDLLAIVRVLREFGNPYTLPVNVDGECGPPYVDVNGDGAASVADLLEVVQRIRADQAAALGGEGEGELGAERRGIWFPLFDATRRVDKDRRPPAALGRSGLQQFQDLPMLLGADGGRRSAPWSPDMSLLTDSDRDGLEDWEAVLDEIAADLMRAGTRGG
ncbi:MAG: hypothetical protein KY475_25725, partial [Planctomycetes bacterium]|nr:hypothetical protein [Planctomycetota bacterium]